MSAHNPCTCPGSRKQKMKNWYVVKGCRNTNYSYFETPKGCAHYSDYSLVMCSGKGCFGRWRSKAKYVDDLPEREMEI